MTAWNSARGLVALTLTAVLLCAASVTLAGNGSGGGLRTKSRYGKRGQPEADAPPPKPADPSGRSDASRPPPPPSTQSGGKAATPDSGAFKTPAPSAPARRPAPTGSSGSASAGPAVSPRAVPKASTGGVPYIPLTPFPSPTTQPTTQPAAAAAVARAAPSTRPAANK